MFKKRLFGKWVLAGEYSVLRGYPAIVYPLAHYYIDFYYKDSINPQTLQIKKTGKYKLGLDFALSPLIDKALKTVHKKKEDLTGFLHIKGFLPFGAGLGASAVICSGVASLFAHKKWIAKHNVKPFATTLENLFHGKSSGMDVHVVVENKAAIYQKNKKIKTPDCFQTKPKLYLSYCGARSFTSYGISKVKYLFKTNPALAEKTDKQMAKSTKLCLQAIKQNNHNWLKEALHFGEKCFKTWGLISYDLEKHITYLKKQGALAVKPTGSGLGGHVISMWKKKPSSMGLQKKLIPLNL